MYCYVYITIELPLVCVMFRQANCEVDLVLYIYNLFKNISVSLVRMTLTHEGIKSIAIQTFYNQAFMLKPTEINAFWIIDGWLDQSLKRLYSHLKWNCQGG